MGAWGLGLFQSDHDLLIVTELDVQAGLLLDDAVFRALQQLSIKHEAEKGATAEGKGSTGDGSMEKKVDHSLYAKNCSNPQWVKIRLQEGPSIVTLQPPSDLIRMIDKYTTATKAQKELCNPYGDAYKTVILGACFMTLGCTLPSSFKELLTEIYAKVGLMADGVNQMRKALNGPKAYVDGEPYDFGSPTEQEVNGRGGPPNKDRIAARSRMLNVPAPNDSATPEMLRTSSLSEKMKDHILEEAAITKAFVNEVEQSCIACTAGKSEGGGDLRFCQRCKVVKYCGKACQTKDWDEHKRACKYAKAVQETGKTVFIGNRPLPKDWKDNLMKPVEEHIAKS